ncbi:MAG: hypothetical protein AUG89_08680 [Acidobacteria bacterium 13_1_20CM_4_56_7]|nr:MAG: hypothetical protein AUG89_08680 [Acidobacteria bacterium 13_1_20CM_4_56_7]
MLGRTDLNSAEIYTQVAIRKLQQIHTATHPGAALDKKKPAVGRATQEEEQRKAALLEALGSEADEEKESEE